MLIGYELDHLIIQYYSTDSVYWVSRLLADSAVQSNWQELIWNLKIFKLKSSLNEASSWKFSSKHLATIDGLQLAICRLNSVY